jgi:hypothetical protein
MLLQAKSLGISYAAKIFTDNESEQLKTHGISEAVAAVLL